MTASHLTFELADEAATRALGSRLAGHARPGDVIALGGDLGAGKTSLARAFVRAALTDETADVPSPTFTLVQTYPAATYTIWHIDAYRLKSPEEVWELGLEDALDGGVVLIEWPDRLGPLLPARRLGLTLEVGAGEEARIATLEDHGEAGWIPRLAEAEPAS